MIEPTREQRIAIRTHHLRQALLDLKRLSRTEIDDHVKGLSHDESMAVLAALEAEGLVRVLVAGRRSIRDDFFLHRVNTEATCGTADNS